MSVHFKRLPDAAATPWSAASFCIERGKKTVLFDHQDSRESERGRSILLWDPVVWLTEQQGRWIEGPSGKVIDDPIRWMKEHHRQVDSWAKGASFAGGIAGFLGFEFGWSVDDVAGLRRSSKPPDGWVGRFEAAAVFDHGEQAWSAVGRSVDAVEAVSRLICDAPGEPRVGQGAGIGPGADPSPDGYRQKVEQAVDAIYRGEFFEVNFTERFRGRWRGDRRRLYHELRRRAPGDFGGLVDVEGLLIASVSPEQFLSVDMDHKVRTRPIKGTRPRGATPEEDEALARQLLNSEKDRAENVMIVDLMRNDLTRVCRPGSVRAVEICELHSFEAVHHLISTVEGELADRFCALDAFIAGFPAGSITGAPKLRAMEWIADVESTARGPYTGSMFYWSDHGRLDSNVLIRTAVLCDGEVEYGSGGAVVADSRPDAEYEEALWKAAPFLELLEDP